MYDKEQDKIIYKPISYVPGLYKIFGKPIISHMSVIDEIIVNAADNF